MLLLGDSLFMEFLSALKKLYRRYIPEKIRKKLRYPRRVIRKFIYGGKAFFSPGKAKYFCPCCGTKLLTFVAGHFLEHPEFCDTRRYLHTRQDVICPVCYSLPRHRILASWCEEHLQLLRSSSILYFAPEVSMMLFFKRNGISCMTADLYQEADLQLDIQDMILQDGSFDFIFCNHVLEHVNDFRAALSEVYRVLCPGGSFICSFPMDPDVDVVEEGPVSLPPEEHIRRFGQRDHNRVFGMHADHLLQEAGFAVEWITGERYGEEILPVIGPADYDAPYLFLCRKVPLE